MDITFPCLVIWSLVLYHLPVLNYNFLKQNPAMFNTAQHSNTNNPIGRIGSPLYVVFVKPCLLAFIQELAILLKQCRSVDSMRCHTVNIHAV